MAQLQTLSSSELSVAEHAEVEAAMKQRSPQYLPDNNDIFVLWICLLLAGLGAIGGSFLHVLPALSSIELLLLVWIALVPWILLLLVGIALVGWTVSTVVRTHGKRGCLSTSFGTFLVRGPKLKGVRHGDVAAIKRRGIRTKTQSFTVFELVTKDGQKLTMYAHGGWATHAIEAIEKVNGKTPVSEY